MRKLSLNKRERIKGSTSFEKIYNSGSKTVSSDRRVRAIYKVEFPVERPFVKLGVAVSKKAGNACFRNRIKRLLRESYRLNKPELTDNLGLYILLSPYSFLDRNRKYRLSYFSDSVIDILNKIRSGINAGDPGA